MDIVVIANFCGGFSKADTGRFNYLSTLLAEHHQVEVITSSFVHGMKAQRKIFPQGEGFTVTYLREPGYKKNISLQRFASHAAWGKEVAKYLAARAKPDVVYCAVPSLTAPLAAARCCRENGIRFVVDVQDLWPEAFGMVFRVPLLSGLVFSPFKRRVDEIYAQADAVCGVSRGYVERALSVNRKCDAGHVVFLGTDVDAFDLAAQTSQPVLTKDGGEELWLGYCGTLGASYDIPCVLEALRIVKERGFHPPKFILMGNGERKAEFEEMARQTGVDAVFLGMLPYARMCAQLEQCDMVVNPIVKGSAASIINKHGDYAACGRPVINTQESREYRDLIDEYRMGLNCGNGDARDVAEKLIRLIGDRELRTEMGRNARRCAEERFDRRSSYQELVAVVEGRLP